MPLSVGDKLGPYEILAPIGAGGMGDVYARRDTKLKLDLALEVLTEAFAGDAERMTRFQREAEVLTSQSPHQGRHLRSRRSRTPELISVLVGSTLSEHAEWH